jgi:hypothetical protein
MTVVARDHHDWIEIVQKPEIASGTIGSTAMLLGAGLLATCVFLAIIAILLFGQFQAGTLAAVEFWIGIAIMVPGLLAFMFFGLWELSNGLPRRIGINPTHVEVRYAMPIPRAFDIPRTDAGPTASVYYRVHRNYAEKPFGYITIKSRKPYVRCGRRLIGPMDDWDAKALAEAMNVALSAERRHGTPQREKQGGWA